MTSMLAGNHPGIIDLLRLFEAIERVIIVIHTVFRKTNLILLP